MNSVSIRSLTLPALLVLCLGLSLNALAVIPDNLSLKQVQTHLADGEYSIEQLAEHYLARIARYDDQGININAVVQINPHWRSRAQTLDNQRKEGQSTGPLHGAIVLLKDNIDTGEGMVNSAGSWLLREHRPADDAFLVQRLRDAGALILGKTNLSEWANFRSTKSSSGWSSLYGQTVNPHDTTRSPCGSSSGSGAAIAADFALMAVGTETDGSVVCPSAVNGIVGIKPSIGRVSRDGIIPISHSQDTAGPMARSVADAVMLLNTMQGKDAADDSTLAPIDLTVALNPDGLRGKRVGILRNFLGYHPDLDRVFEQQLEVLKAAGAELVDPVSMDTRGQWGRGEYQVLLSEFKDGLNRYFESSNAPIKNLQDAITLNEANSAITMPYFGQEIFMQAADSHPLDSEEYQSARQDSLRAAAQDGIDALIAKHNLDVLIAPTTAPAWKIDRVNGDHYMGSASGAPAVAGYPHVTVPMGFVAHMPVGLSFIGGNKQDIKTIEAAYAYEQVSQALRPPRLTQH
ncbi:amidase [Aestuariibacter salexigens]|uniref:amidase n=1 Tax=Aestuariibacter salexigens TaxID=226010 RepID=UPI00040D1979|nr:amidase [Aestuariibacter salexigens]